RYCLIRGLMRAGRQTDAAAYVRQLVQQVGKPAAVARALTAMPSTAPLVTDRKLCIPEFERVRSGIEGELQGVVEHFLNADEVKCFLGEMPLEKQLNAREAFLRIQFGEFLLFFYDWGFWQNAKTGFAITTQRVLWKCMWEAPVVIPLRQIAIQSIKTERF